MELIQRIARDNRLWGAERIRAELLKLGIRVAKRTVQKYMRSARPRPPSGQTWATFLRNHMHQIWACDFIQTYDIWFRPLFAFFIPLLGLPRVVIELGSRKIVSVGVTSNPSSSWVAQQLRNATAFGVGPRFIIRDRDDKYGGEFDRVARGVGTRVLKTPVRAPKANSFCERFLGSVRRECLDHSTRAPTPRTLGRGGFWQMEFPTRGAPTTMSSTAPPRTRASTRGGDEGGCTGSTLPRAGAV